MQKRIILDIDKTKEGNTVVRFTRLTPKPTVIVPRKIEDYTPKKVKEYICYDQKTNPLKVALLKLIKMGNNAPNNRIFQDVVVL